MTEHLSAFHETNSDRLERLVSLNALTLDLVSALSGDRKLIKPEKLFLDDMKKKRGIMFFSDVLFLITHQYFTAELAEDTWKHILSHKDNLSAKLGRNVKLVVAAIDYLSNSTMDMKNVTLITEDDVSSIIKFSQHDNLTGLFNHAHFYQSLEMQLRYYLRYGTSVALMMIDIDNFKPFNDKYGHQKGDSILALMGAFLMETTRGVDICCRYGGDEFAVILPLSGTNSASLLASRIQERISSLSNRYKISLSIGIASCGKDTNTTTLLVKKADDALYQAKRNGKNQVVALA